MTAVPVITIDGPTASGKGTIAQRVAEALGFHYLDSGALYRLVAWRGPTLMDSSSASVNSRSSRMRLAVMPSCAVGYSQPFTFASCELDHTRAPAGVRRQQTGEARPPRPNSRTR